jgi:hypothetical protein
MKETDWMQDLFSPSCSRERKEIITKGERRRGDGLPLHHCRAQGQTQQCGLGFFKTAEEGKRRKKQLLMMLIR